MHGRLLRLGPRSGLREDEGEAGAIMGTTVCDADGR
jgi:hypothetical protein